jgi:hypothetical protein
MGKSEEGGNKDIDEEKENKLIVLLCIAITEIKPQSGFFFRTLVNI